MARNCHLGNWDAFKIQGVNCRGKPGTKKLIQRRYGKKWKTNITRIEKRFIEILLRRIRPDYGTCFDLQSELARQIAEGWVYLSGKVDAAYHRARGNPGVRICKRM